MKLSISPADSSAHLFDLLEAISQKAADKLAIVDKNSSVTFNALKEQASFLCAKLCETGIQPKDRVAVIFPNASEFVVAAFAIWKCGAILVPLHVHFQENEILKYITDCGVRAIITNARMGSVVQFIQEKGIGLEHAWLHSTGSDQWKYVGGHAPQAARHMGNYPITNDEHDWPALTQYSTGSTGLSKRVTRSHRQLIGEFHSVASVMKITGNDRILGAAPFFHNYGLMNAMICSVLSGATLYTVNDFFPRDVARLIEKDKITGFPGVPFMHQLLADLRGTVDFSSLSYVLSAGAPLSEKTADKFKAVYGITIRQLYGSTETGVISIERPSTGGNLGLSVGFPIPGVTVRIVDDSNKIVPEEVEGHIGVNSRFAAFDYDNLEGKSESYFQEETFFPGDLGRISADGRLVLCGRKRQFINVAGNKVDPAEVELVLRGLPAIAEAVVIGIPDGAASEKIKAVLVVSAPCSRKEILDHCVTKLADFKRPRIIEFRKEIPKSPLGKILRKYLIDDYNEAKPGYIFNPRSGFEIASSRTSSGGASVDLAAVPPFLRALLVTDGTVTKHLEAYFWEPIDVNLLLHVQVESEQLYPEIEVKIGEPIIKRHVILRGRITGAAYAFAETVMASKGVSTDLNQSLVEGTKGIGELLRERRLETYRELVSVQHSHAGEWSGYLGVETTANVMVRCYKIYLDRRPAIQIVEVFPDARFQSLA